jgi:hypothetical protein
MSDLVEDIPVEAAPVVPATPVRDVPAQARAGAGVLGRVASLNLYVVVAAVALFVPAIRAGGGVTLGYAIVAAALVGGLVSVLTWSLAIVLRLLAEQVEALGRIEQGISSGLERLAALESIRSSAGAGTTSIDLKSQHLAEIRQAIRAASWDVAGTLSRNYADAHPDDPASARVAVELDQARHAASHELVAKIEAAREVNDPDRVIELHDTLKPLLSGDALRTFDRDLAKWFLALIHRRLRAGTVRADVAVLAARVAGSFDDTPEGASLRASLPTLRRAAGLCARCAQPYTGIADACPVCLARVVSHVPASLPAPVAAPEVKEPEG